MRNKFLFLMMMALASLAWMTPAAAQSSNATDVDDRFTYGETVGGLFDADIPPPHRWTFEAAAHEQVQLTLRRVGGQFTPSLRLMNPAGEVVPFATQATDIQVYTLLDGTQPGVYTVEVGGDVAEDAIINPPEYTLALERLGTRPERRDIGLTPLPELGTARFPNLFAEDAVVTNDSERLGIGVFGGTATRPNLAGEPSRFVLQGVNGRTLELINRNPIRMGLTSVGFVDDGVGFQLGTGAQFFTDQNITGFSYLQGVVSFEMANGQTFVSDFFGMEQVWAVDDLVAIRLTNGSRVILAGSQFNLQRRGGVRGEGPNAEPIWDFRLQNDDIISTDGAGWDTLAYLITEDGPQTRALYGPDMRFITDLNRVALFQQGNSTLPEIDIAGTDIQKTEITLTPPEGAAVSLSVSPSGMGDIEVADDILSVRPLDGRVLQEPLDVMARGVIEDRALYVERTDGSTRLSLPDGTEIEGLATLPVADSTALPNEEGYVPSGRNNLGTTHIDTHPQIAPPDGLLPVNRANGNFYYPVQEFHIPSQTLELTWTRHYNSLSAAPAPAYLLTSPATYPVMGDGWRHSYQYELDLRTQHFGEVRMVLPDGATHVFTQTTASPNRFLSPTLLSWTLTRLNGETGAWQANTLDGQTYDFDRAGRLSQMTDGNGLSLWLSPAPRDAIEAMTAVDGTFFVEPYGRRFEVYTDINGRIINVLDTQQREIQYAYTDGLLTNVTYPDAVQTATYTYAEGVLSGVNDVYSPYLDELAIQADPQGRVSRLVRNPEGREDLQQAITFDYDPETNTTTETTTVSDVERVSRWQHDDLFRLVRHDTPVSDWTYLYTYEGDSPLLSEITQPDLTRIGLRYDEQGYLTELLDPLNRGTTQYRFSYITLPNGQRRLTEIAYPSLTEIRPREQFSYNEAGQPIERVRSGGDAPNEVVRYEYDLQGRLVTKRQLAQDDSGIEIATRYEYDDFGYLSRASTADGIDVVGFRHDLAGRLIGFIDERGVETSLTWNLERNLLTGMEVNNTQAAFSYVYDDRNNITAFQQGDATTTFTYNRLNQVVTMTDALEQTTIYEHDVQGNLTAIILPDTPEDPSTIRYTYDGLDRLSQVTSPSGLITAYEWRVAEESTQTVHTVTDPFGDSIRYVYNGLGRVASVRKTDRNENRLLDYALTYDPLGRLTRVQELHGPTQRELVVQYDLWGRPTLSHINDVATTYTYDAFGRLQSVTLPGDRTVQYERDALGDIRTVVYPDGETTQHYRYGGNGTLASFIDPMGFETLYSHDSLNRLTSILHPDNSRESYTYDVLGNITAYTDPRDNQTLAEYDALGRVTRLQDPGGVGQTFSYSPLGQLTEVLQGGTGTRYTYDREGNPVAVTPPESRAILYSYDSLGRITSVTNAVGHNTRYTYDRRNRVSTIIDPLGNETQYQWSNSGRLNFLDTPLGQRYAYAYNDPLGRLTRITNPPTQDNPLDTQLTYDPDGYITRIRLATANEIVQGDGIFHNYTYDANGRMVSYLPPESDSPWLLEYDRAGQLVAATDPRGFQTTYRYDAMGQVIEVVYPDATREEYAYDATGNIIEHVTTDGRISRFVYDENNRMVQRTDNPGSDARVQTFGYDELGNLVLWADAAGNTTTYRYDTSGRVRLIERGRGEEAAPLAYRYVYDPVGNLTEILLPNNSDRDNPNISLTYDNLNRRIRFVDSLANVWAYSYDAESNLIQFSDPLGSTTQYGYDGANRLNQITYPVGADVRLRYDLGPNQRGYVSPQIESIDDLRDRERIAYELDRAGRLVAIDRGDDVAVRFNRDNLGNVIEKVNADGTTTTYIYDARNRMVAAADAATEHTLDVEYDEAGRVRQIRNPNSRYIFTYDDLGQLTTIRGDSRIAYTYDINGNLLTRDAGPLGITEYTYDDLDRPVRIEKDGDGIDVAYVSSEDGSFQRDWIASITRDNGSRTTYAYDLTGRIQQIIHFDAEDTPVDILNYTYDAVGNINRITRLDGWTIIYSYDANHQVTSERWMDDQNQTAYAAGYRYDAAGNRTERTVRIGFDAPVVTSYRYNPGNQLVSEERNVSSGGDETTWTIGIFVLFVAGGGTLWIRRRRRPSLRWLALLPAIFVVPVAAGIFQQEDASNTILYAYDANGNLSEVAYPDGRTQQHTYDSQNRLSRVQGVTDEGRTVDIAFRYDAFSRVHSVRNNIQNETYRLHYDGHELIGIEDVASGDLQSFFVPFPGEIHRTDVDDGTQYWRLHDALGSVRLALSEEGLLVEPELAGLNYDLFGQLITPYGQESAYRFGPGADIARADADDVRLLPPEPIALFRSEVIEPNTGYYLLGLRAYEPASGRFIQRDPLRHDPLGTLYTYAYNRPGIYEDPTGMTPQIGREGVEAINLPTEAIPNTAPPPLLPDIPMPGAVHLRQAQELHRPLALTHLLQSEVNDAFAALSPTACNFRIRHVNPIRGEENSQRHPILTNVVTTFDLETGWVPPGMPDVTDVPPPFAPLEAALPILQQTEAISHWWQAEPCSTTVALPTLPQPQPFSSADLARMDLVQLLQEIPLYPATFQETTALTTLDPINIPGLPSTDMTWNRLEPQIDILNPGGFGDLYADTLDYYTSTLTLPIPGPADSQRPTTGVNIVPQLP